MTDAERIESLKAELKIERQAHNDLFTRLCEQERELERLSSMRGVLLTLMRLTEDVREERKRNVIA